MLLSTAIRSVAFRVPGIIKNTADVIFTDTGRNIRGITYTAIPQTRDGVHGGERCLLRRVLNKCGNVLRMRNHHDMGCALDHHGVF